AASMPATAIDDRWKTASKYTESATSQTRIAPFGERSRSSTRRSYRGSVGPQPHAGGGHCARQPSDRRHVFVEAFIAGRGLTVGVLVDETRAVGEVILPDNESLFGRHRLPRTVRAHMSPRYRNSRGFGRCLPRSLPIN